MPPVAISTKVDFDPEKGGFKAAPCYARCPQTEQCCVGSSQMVHPNITQVHPKHGVTQNGGVTQDGGVTQNGDVTQDGGVTMKGSVTPLTTISITNTTCANLGEKHDQELKKESSPSIIFQAFRKHRISQKLVFVFTIAVILFLTAAFVHKPWLVLYFYTVAHPIFMAVRLVIYWKQKWQFYLLDLCYFVNWAMYIYIWACPDVKEYFLVLYSLCTGPVVLATILFRNSLVLHSTDKMTSCALHVMPLLISFIVRWYPVQVSEHWYTPFVHFQSHDFAHLAIWLWAVPLAFYLFHMLLYLFLLKVVFRPGDEYDYSFKYLAGLTSTGGGGILQKLVGILGPDRKQLTYCLLTVLYGLVGFSFTPLMFNFIIANYIYIALLLLIVTWNGASYYVEVFGPKSFT